jgi:hypothetical protein
MLGIGSGESYVIKQSGLWIQRDHTLDIESVLLADGVKGRVLIGCCYCYCKVCALHSYKLDEMPSWCLVNIAPWHVGYGLLPVAAKYCNH